AGRLLGRQVGQAVDRDGRRVDELDGPLLLAGLRDGHLQQVEGAVDVDAIGEVRLALGLGREQGGEVIDAVEVVGRRQGVEQGDVGNVPGDDAVATRLDVGVGQVQVQGDEAYAALGEAVDEAVADLA